MKKVIMVLMMGLALTGFSGTKKIKAAWFETVITPDIGCRIAGYEWHDYSVEKYDDLLATGLGLDDGENKILLVSVDLLGLDYDTSRKVRELMSKASGIPVESIMISCTHTHQGPMTRLMGKNNLVFGEDGMDDRPGSPEVQYIEKFVKLMEQSAADLMKKEWKEYYLGYYCQMVDENRNRRYTTSENKASFNAHRPFLHRISDGIADKELGTIVLLDDKNYPQYVIGNYAAHALTAHAPGLGGLRISSDFPGFYRRYIESETGAKAMFVQGAAGDLVTKDDECGNAAAKKVGENLAMASMIGIISMQRCFARYVFEDPKVGGISKIFKAPLLASYRKRFNADTQDLEIQVLGIGDVCFVATPGEVVSELGLEIKWNSPFAHAFTAYLGTGYIGYIVPANLMAAGGYESYSMRFKSKATLDMLRVAQDAMFELRDRMHPEDTKGVDQYPDDRKYPIVNVPEMWKNTKMER